MAARETPGTAALPGEAVRRSTETVRSSDFRANVVTKRPFTLRERLLHSLRENFRRVRARPAILLTALLCGVLCAALLAILVEVLRRHQKNVMRDDVRRQAVHAARFVEQLFQQLAMPAQSLSVIVYERPSWPDLEPRLPLLAREILSQPVTRNRAIAEVAQILVLPDGIVSFAYPNDPVLPRALGLDVLDHPVPSARQAAAAARDDRTCALQGPYPFEGESLVVVRAWRPLPSLPPSRASLVVPLSRASFAVPLSRTFLVVPTGSFGLQFRRSPPTSSPQLQVRCPIFVPISRDGVRLNQDSTRASITGRRYSDVIPPAPGAEHSDAGPVAFWGFTSAALDLERFVDVAIEDSRTIDRHM